MNLQIRAATLDDLAGIQHIHRDDNDPWRHKEECEAWVSKRLERGFDIQVAVLDGQIVGHAEWIVSDEPGGKFLYLGMLQVDADFQGRGIGRRMIEAGTHIARENGCAKIKTSPDIETGSHIFYEKCGFVQGRVIMSVTLPTKDNGYAQAYAQADNAPFSVIKEQRLVFGTAQASSRHMWEVHNEKPATDDRHTATMLCDSGGCIQLGWFDDSPGALALYWGDSPCVEDILTFGHRLGLQQVAFLFFEEHAGLFDAYDAEISASDIEIYKMIEEITSPYALAAEYIQSRLPSPAPISIGIILGSGLGALGEQLGNATAIPYSDIPGWASSSAPGHEGRLIAGELSGQRVMCMQGRLHRYEGHDFSAITFPMRVMHSLGVRTLIVTNAAGGINFDYAVGDIMLINDHINLMGGNPLIGPNADDFGERFFDMGTTYTPALRVLAHNCAAKLGMNLRKGVYVAVTGPSYETPAEIRAFRALGADAVGMSTVPEVIAARHCGMDILGLSLITNHAAGVKDEVLCGGEVIAIGQLKAKEMQALVTKIIGELD